MILAALAMVYAGVLEIYRKKDMEANGYITQSLGKDNFTASKLSMFIQIPEFAFIGSSEVFASISGEFLLVHWFESLLTLVQVKCSPSSQVSLHWLQICFHWFQ